MKNIILILSLMLLPACDYLLQEKEIEVGNIYDYDFEGSEEIPEFKDIRQAVFYVVRNSIYNYDSILYGKKEYYATPQEFFYNRNNKN